MKMNLQVDSLSLRLAGVSEADGRRLAQLVGESLASGVLSAPAGTVAAMRVTLEAQPGEALESMAQRIAAQMESQNFFHPNPVPSTSYFTPGGPALAKLVM